jgi:AcrR family transcriptional regulator
MTDIAARAGVSVGTVYHHFPTYQDAVAACTRHVDESCRCRPPTSSPDSRRCTHACAGWRRRIFGFYQRLPAYERVRCERWGMPPIEPTPRARRTTAWR